MSAEESRIEELKSLLRESGLEYLVVSEDGKVAQVNVWIGKDDDD